MPKQKQVPNYRDWLLKLDINHARYQILKRMLVECHSLLLHERFPRYRFTEFLITPMAGLIKREHVNFLLSKHYLEGDACTPVLVYIHIVSGWIVTSLSGTCYLQNFFFMNI